ncbi:hypothetical protein ASG87_11875 [Frateuria sp. Soil773]|uniref:hypothetical protein n=1 Tax=Frateuria sp. Soil773 TaxID=1736407 RepID=UPI0006F9C077|nr:hypothetical protein [Frateuria sp. Soil773]KRF02161.1 hypothetical protein ASG87_11875 [Frateuria sp. Soil773]
MDEPLITLSLRLTQAELSSLLMAQITQTRNSRLTLGEQHMSTVVDRAVLEKLMLAQQRMAAERSGAVVTAPSKS